MNKYPLHLLITFPVAVLAALLVIYTGGFGGTPPPWRLGLGLVAFSTIIALPFLLGPRRGLSGAAALLVAPVVFWAVQAPQSDRDWWEPASRTAHATIDGDLVTIHDIRDFRYVDNDTWEASWYDATYDLRELRQSYFLLTTFGDIEGIGHVMVSFQFGDDQFLILSVEIRREDGEGYDPIGGVFRQYELMYVAADERDALALRTHIHQDPTWMIPMNAGPEKTAEFFLSMVERMTDLHHHPEWYNTVTNSCSSNLAFHYEVINDVKLPPDYRILMPGFSGELLAELDLLPDGITAQEAMDRFRVDQVARELPLDEHFSTALRQAISSQPRPDLPQ